MKQPVAVGGARLLRLRLGLTRIAEQFLDAKALEPEHPLHDRLATIRDRMTPQSLWWFRSCDVFGTERGQDFAPTWTQFFGCRAAGHTYTIHILQSGLHVLAPGDEPSWSTHEGVKVCVDRAITSSVFAPNTITFLQGRPKG